VEAGHSQRAAAAHFGVSAAFAVKLVAAWRQTGRLVAKPEGAGAPPSSIRTGIFW
jgi:transposase